MESCINYMGSLSEPIKVESRIRQGCLFSPLAFILGTDGTQNEIDPFHQWD